MTCSMVHVISYVLHVCVCVYVCVCVCLCVCVNKSKIVSEKAIFVAVLFHSILHCFCFTGLRLHFITVDGGSAIPSLILSVPLSSSFCLYSYSMLCCQNILNLICPMWSFFQSEFKVFLGMQFLSFSLVDQRVYLLSISLSL